MVRPLWLSLATLVLLGCSSGSSPPADSGAPPADAAGDALPAEGGGACGTQTCGAGQVCVITESGGGACLLPNDAGLCPNGMPSTGCCNTTTTSYQCSALPASCNGTLSCPCASSLCSCGGCQVGGPATLNCSCLAP